MADTTMCNVAWRAFGLEPEHSCANPATVVISIACVHEHVARSAACPGCLALMESYGPEWGCPWCTHPCEAPLVWVPLEAAQDGESKCICVRFADTGGFRVADLRCPVHGVDGTNPGDGAAS